MAKSALRQALVKVHGIDGYFATKTGSEQDSATSEAWDGGDTQPDTLTGPAIPSNLVVSRPYDPQRDASVVRRLRRLVGQWTTTVTVQDTDAQLIPLPVPPEVFPKAKLVHLTPPETDAASGEAKRYELTFAISNIA